MPRKRKLRKERNVEIVKTERDTRRASKENDDTLDITDDEVDNEPTKYVTLGMSRHRRSKARKTTHAVPDQPFDFSDLPPEVRDEIYECILVSNSATPIRLDGHHRVFTPGGIETAILRTSRQVYAEAIKVLHERNRFLVFGAECDLLKYGVAFRVDDPRDAATTSRQLRSGRSVGMVNFGGLIYKPVFYRLRYVEFHVDLFSRKESCDWSVLWGVFNVRLAVCSMCKNITDASSPELSVLRPQKTDWTLVIHAPGKLGLRSFALSLKPLFIPEILELVHSGRLKVELRGTFPPTWKEMFKEMMCKNFSTAEVEELDDVAVDPSDLEEQLEERLRRRQQWDEIDAGNLTW